MNPRIILAAALVALSVAIGILWTIRQRKAAPPATVTPVTPSQDALKPATPKTVGLKSKPPKPVDPEIPASIDRYIKGLTHSEYSVRQYSQTQLVKLGPHAGSKLVAWLKAQASAMDEKLNTTPLFLGSAVAHAPEESVADLLPLLRHANLRLRLCVVVPLAQIAKGKKSEPAVRAELIRLLDDPNASIRTEAIQALGTLGPSAAETVPALLKAVEDTKSRSYALDALRNMGPAARPGTQLFLQLARDSAIGAKYAPLRALAAAEPPLADVLPTMQTFFAEKNIGPLACEVVARSTPNPESKLLELLNSEDSVVQINACTGIANARRVYPSLLPPLTQLAHAGRGKTASPYRPACMALAAMYPASLASIQSLSDTPKTRQVRTEIVQQILRDHKSGVAPQDLDALAVVILQNLPVDKSQIPPELAEIGPTPAMLQQLPKFLADLRVQGSEKDTAEQNRGILAARIVASLDEAAIPGLREALKDSTSRLNAALACENLGTTAAPLVSDLQNLLESPACSSDELLCANVLSALGGIGPDAVEAIPSILTRLKTQSKSVPYKAVEALGKIKSTESAPELIRHLRASRSNSAMREAILTALGRIQAVDAIPDLIEELSKDATGYWKTQECAAEALGSFGTRAKSALPHLERAYNASQAVKKEDSQRPFYERSLTRAIERIKCESILNPNPTPVPTPKPKSPDATQF